MIGGVVTGSQNQRAIGLLVIQLPLPPLRTSSLFPHNNPFLPILRCSLRVFGNLLVVHVPPHLPPCPPLGTRMHVKKVSLSTSVCPRVPVRLTRVSQGSALLPATALACPLPCPPPPSLSDDIVPPSLLTLEP